MNSPKKSRVLQVKQSTTGDLKGNHIITKYFSTVTKLEDSCAKANSTNNNTSSCGYHEENGVVVLSDSSEDEDVKMYLLHMIVHSIVRDRVLVRMADLLNENLRDLCDGQGDCKCNQENIKKRCRGSDEVSESSKPLIPDTDMRYQPALLANERKLAAKTINGFSKATKIKSDSRNLFSSMNMYLAGSNHDLNPGSAHKKPLGNCHRNSISGKPSSLTGTKSFKKRISSPARLSNAGNRTSDMKRKQRTLNLYVSPKKMKLESSSSSKTKLSSSDTSSVRSLTPSSTLPVRSPAAVIDLTQRDAGKANHKVNIPSENTPVSIQNSSIIVIKSSPKRIDAPTQNEETSKKPKEKALRKLNFVDEKLTDDLDDMYNLFNVETTDSSPTVTPTSLMSLSEDEHLPMFASNTSVHGTIGSIPSNHTKSNVVEYASCSKSKANISSSPPTSSDISIHVNQHSGSPKDKNSKKDYGKMGETISLNLSSCSSLDDTLSEESSEEIFCTPKGISLPHTAKVLNKLRNETGPVTPRKFKRDKYYPSKAFSSDEDKTEKQSKSKQKNHRMTYTLNKILKDKKDNEELKHIETKLLEDLKKGGFARTLNNPSSDDEFPDSMDQDYEKLHKIMNCDEDCLGVEESHKRYKVFSRKRLYCCYCSHQISLDESVALMFCQETNTQSRVEFLVKESESILGYLANCQDGSSLENGEDNSSKAILSWLIQILSSHTDISTLDSTLSAFSSGLDCTRLKMLSTSYFYKALCNLGIKTKFLHDSEKFENKPCKMCKVRKNPCLPSRNLIHILKAFRLCALRHPQVFDQHELYKLITTFLLLSSSVDGKLAITRSILSGCIEVAANAMQDWPTMALKVIRYIMRQIDDIHTLHYLITTLPYNTERTAWLRNALAYMVLVARLDKSISLEEHEEEIKANGPQLCHVSKLASKLSVSNVQSMCDEAKANLSNRQVYNTLWACMSLLQVCIGTEKIHHSQRPSLESVTESLRSLSMSIRDIGCLYRSEAKYYVGLTIALAEFQLQAMPRSQLYQQGIFKYLSTSRVNEEIIEADDTEDNEDGSEASPSDADHCSNSPEDGTFSPDAISAKQSDSFSVTNPLEGNEIASKQCYVALSDCERLIKDHDGTMWRDSSSGLIATVSEKELPDNDPSLFEEQLIEKASAIPEVAAETPSMDVEMDVQQNST